MIRSHHHGEVVVAIVKRLERPRLGLARADTDLGGAFLNAANHLPARALLQIDPQAAKACFFLDATQFKIQEKTEESAKKERPDGPLLSCATIFKSYGQG